MSASVLWKFEVQTMCGTMLWRYQRSDLIERSQCQVLVVTMLFLWAQTQLIGFGMRLAVPSRPYDSYVESK